MPHAVNDGVRIRYEVEGSGPPLVLHTGFIGALEDWYDAGYVAALRDDYRLILLDPRGQGQSDKPHDVAAYAREERVGDVRAVLDAAGVEQAHFWGYSMGGVIGFALGVLAPDRATSLILGGASPYAREQVVENHPLYQGLQLGMAAMVAAFEQDDPNFWISADERARWLAADAEALTAALRAGFSYPSLADALPALHVPALIYCGTNDDPDPKARSADELPDATFVAIAGLDHAAGFYRRDLALPHVTTFLARLLQAPTFASS
jgi:pimeloyl-ACP methyl ester carboxylesterase